MADMRHDSVQTLNTTLAGLDEADLARRVQALADSCQQRLDSAGVAFEGVRERIELDMLYAGQSHTVNVPVERQALTRTGIAAAFEAAYRRAYGRSLDGMPVRVLNLRYARIGMRPKVRSGGARAHRRGDAACWAQAVYGTGNGGTRRVTNGWRCLSTRKWPARHPGTARHHDLDRARLHRPRRPPGQSADPPPAMTPTRCPAPA